MMNRRRMSARRYAEGIAKVHECESDVSNVIDDIDDIDDNDDIDVNVASDCHE